MAKKLLEQLGLDEDKPVNVTRTYDNDGEKRLTVVVQGNENDDTLDQTVSAAKLLIGNVHNQLHDDMDGMGQYKAFMSILDHIGGIIRSDLPYDYEGMNIELVKEYIDWFLGDNLHKEPEFQAILDQKDEDE
jgi:hypothetical protein